MPVLTGSLVRVPLGCGRSALAVASCFSVHDLGGGADLFAGLRHAVLAIPDSGALCGLGGRYVFGGHALCGQVVWPERQGLAMGTWCGQLSGAALTRAGRAFADRGRRGAGGGA